MEITKLNSSSMKTVVETYIIEETQELIYDNEKLDKWNQYVKELGLTGQTAICKPDKSPIPFLHMKESMVNVFSELCPRHVGIEAYDKTPIPVEILDLVVLSKKEDYFTRIEIWYDDATPDPVCVGVMGDYVVYNKAYRELGRFKTKAEADELKSNPEYHTDYFNATSYYLLGRWADAKQSIAELTAKAKRLFISKKKVDIDRKMKECKRELEDIDNEAATRFGFDDSPIDVPLF